MINPSVDSDFQFSNTQKWDDEEEDEIELFKQEYNTIFQKMPTGIKKASWARYVKVNDQKIKISSGMLLNSLKYMQLYS